MASVSASTIAVHTAAGMESKSSKKSSVKTPPVHPTYLQMSAEAISSLKERTGSSTYAIAKWLEQKYNGLLPANFKKQLHIQLKNQTQKGKLIQIKNSYKLSDEFKKSVKKNIDLNTTRKKSEVNKTSSENASRTTPVLKKVRSVNNLVHKPLNTKSTHKTSSKSNVTTLVCKGHASKPLVKLSKFSTKVTERNDVKVSKTTNRVAKTSTTVPEINDVSAKSAKKVAKTSIKESLSKNVKSLTIKPDSKAASSAKIKVSKSAWSAKSTSAKNKRVSYKTPSVAKKANASKPLVQKNKLVKKVNTSKPLVQKNKLVTKANTSKPLVQKNTLVNAA